MSLTLAEVSHHVRESMKVMPVGKSKEEIEIARSFYTFLFTEFPDLRKYFKGAEKYTAEDVLKSERFEKQGQRMLIAMYILINTIEDEATFRAYARETVNRHRQFKMDPSLWMALFNVYVAFLETKGPVSEVQKQAWKQMGEMFDEECQDHLKNLGLPHV